MDKHLQSLRFAGVLVTLGIVFGDIGTSPLYVFTAITHGEKFNETLILGGVSLVFWTLMIITTLKYVYFSLNADNQGEGGIFALYALLRKYNKKWMIYPALIGCAMLISDGFITPAISIASAVEGLNNINPDLPILPIILLIVVLLFIVQQFGTEVIGRFFGPIIMVWFVVLGLLGINQIIQNPSVLVALNPMYGIKFVLTYPNGFWILGSVFLCTTGAEALYSDLGHCGKRNIRVSWAFVCVLLLFNYFGQAAYCLRIPEAPKDSSIFYAIVPKSLLPYVIALATAATIIASQALISGVFTLVNEGIKLKLWTNLKVNYPSTSKGQIYIPSINLLLMIGCVSVVLLFKKSSNMEAAYGLAITINMVMTTLLLCYYTVKEWKKNKWFIILLFCFFGLIELVFLASNLGKFAHGGWFTLLLSAVFFVLLFFYYRARQLRAKFTEYEPMETVIPILKDVANDTQLSYEATNLVYLTRSSSAKELDSNIVYSLFKKKPKRAQNYWFVHVFITDEPWGISYTVDSLIPKQAFFICFNLGFKEEHRIEEMTKQIHKNMVEEGEISGQSAYESMKKHRISPDFRFILLNSRVSSSTSSSLTTFERWTVDVYRWIKSIGYNSADDFGLNESTTITEYIPIDLKNPIPIKIIDASNGNGNGEHHD